MVGRIQYFPTSPEMLGVTLDSSAKALRWLDDLHFALITSDRYVQVDQKLLICVMYIVVKCIT